MNNGVSIKQRMFLLDFIRIILASFIYARHSIGMYGCNYGHVLNSLFDYMTSPVMTCFFIISGFSIHYQHRSEDNSAEWTKSYLKKRFIAIMPSYLLFVFIWPLLYPSQIKTWALLFPVHLLGIQTVYRSLFGILHNGGTWFVSCLFLCYILYPVIKSIITNVKIWVPLIMLIITHFILMYSNVIIPKFSLDSLYSNPLARAAEFMIGVLFCELLSVLINKDNYTSVKAGGGEATKPRISIIIISVSVLFMISITLGILSKTTMVILVFGYLVIPVILLLLFASFVLRAQIFGNSRIISTLSGMSYQFFLMQLFLWDATTIVLKLFHLSGNKAKILVSFIICTLCAFIIYQFYDKPVRSILKKRIIKSRD